VILAIDPGTSKIGWAIVDYSGRAVDQGILFLDRGAGQLAELIDPPAVRTVVIGDGTNRMNIEAEARRLYPQAEIAVISETDSTVAAWQLKLKEEVGRNPFRRLVFILRQLFNPPPVDDYAARVLAERYLALRRTGQA
jgi:RNase H-fold protein (predicted Holliday junction resolvase)